MDLEEICRWSCEGWIWAPEETLQELVLRKERFMNVEFPQKRTISSSLFNIQDKRVCVIEDNSSLSPWQGAVLWEYETQGIKYPVIQLRKSLPSFWRRLYTQEEMIEHELVHAVRFAYKEPFFEEVLAYQTSSKVWRRFLGPLFMYPWEAAFLLLASLVCLCVSLIQDSFLGTAILLALLGAFFLRLVVLQSLFALCKKKLQKAGCCSEYCLAVMLRLSDKEILKTALRFTKNNIRYFRKLKNLKTRINVIVHLYFKKDEEK